ncbi:hypothetical protein CLV45_2756 [Hymenobacter chitinivorans DSM 11115]|uniref:Uncharacterized protein n=1 Tax=Hymenobacter chitinivorans DSM 11115 TaxID=1121954 RepID=A0A2M9B8Z1_9BACT|nr:hypothetical protein CLV45_2756 [Hymenobacter chitinivorans DSM 11115]
MTVPLIRYWMEVQLSKGLLVMRNFGEPAYSLDDALSLLNSCALHSSLKAPVIVRVVPNGNTLDAVHVLPNMLPPNQRGVWFSIT